MKLLETVAKVKNAILGIEKKDPPQQRDWFGSYLDEDGIVADILKRVSADPVAVKHWLDPHSWRFPLGASLAQMNELPDHAGCLMFAGMSIRNFYGLWDANNPHTEAEDVEITDGIITDPRHPDNMSGRIIDEVKRQLLKFASVPA